MLGIVSFYGAIARAPAMQSKPPMLIADLSADCVLGEDGAWRYRSHVLHPVCVGRDIPLSISIDTQILAAEPPPLGSKLPPGGAGAGGSWPCL